MLLDLRGRPLRRAIGFIPAIVLEAAPKARIEGVPAVAAASIWCEPSEPVDEEKETSHEIQTSRA